MRRNVMHPLDQESMMKYEFEGSIEALIAKLNWQDDEIVSLLVSKKIVSQEVCAGNAKLETPSLLISRACFERGL